MSSEVQEISGSRYAFDSSIPLYTGELAVVGALAQLEQMWSEGSSHMIQWGKDQTDEAIKKVNGDTKAEDISRDVANVNRVMSKTSTLNQDADAVVRGGQTSMQTLNSDLQTMTILEKLNQTQNTLASLIGGWAR